MESNRGTQQGKMLLRIWQLGRQSKQGGEVPSSMVDWQTDLSALADLVSFYQTAANDLMGCASTSDH